MRVSVDYNNMMKKFVGQDGFTDADLARERKRRRTRSITLRKTAARA